MKSQSLTCSVVTREGSVDVVLRNDIHFSALNAALNLKEESDSVWYDFDGCYLTS